MNNSKIIIVGILLMCLVVLITPLAPFITLYFIIDRILEHKAQKAGFSKPKKQNPISMNSLVNSWKKPE